MPGLIITNGDIAADLLAAAGRADTILPWRDVLHEGPIVGGMLEAGSLRRADYLARRFRIDPAEVAAGFAERDAVMRPHADFDRIELWFEHDLYDQLQLVQILSYFADEGRRDGLVLVQADDFLGNQRADTILRFAAGARTLTETDLDLADRVWADLAMPTPESVLERLGEPTDALPFLAGALRRFLEELPAPGTGLGRTEATALAAIDGGTPRPLDLFRQAIAAEEAAFMGDWSFFAILDDLAAGEAPLIAGLPKPSGSADEDGARLAEAHLSLTDAGADVLAGRADRITECGIDRWWGGTRLLSADVWRYDRDAGVLVPPGR